MKSDDPGEHQQPRDQQDEPQRLKRLRKKLIRTGRKIDEFAEQVRKLAKQHNLRKD